jgi:hypothetical protein
VARMMALLIATITAIALIGRVPPSFAAETQQRLRSSLAFLQETDEPVNCRSLDRAYVELDAALGSGLTPGRVFSMNDGTLAVLIVVVDVNQVGAVTAVDFAASLRISALIVHSGDVRDVRTFDPPVRNGANVRGLGGATIDALSFCYRVTFPPPPQAEQPTATTGAVPALTPTPSITQPTATATELTLDVSGEKTAVARAAEIEATATAAAGAAANELATAQARAAEMEATATAVADLAAAADARASEIAATSTSAAVAAAATMAAQETAIAVSEAGLATAQANAAASNATAAALQATLSAPTVTPSPVPPSPTPTPVPPTETPTPEPTATPVPTVLVYETSGATPFADWQPVEGWTFEDGVAKTDGSAPRNWLVVPVPPGLGQNVIVEVQVDITGGDICPRNFGVGVHISESGFFAGGIEWACNPEVIFWSGSNAVVKRALPDGTNLEKGWHTLRIEAIGNQVSIWLDGTEVIAETMVDVPTGNLVAMWSDGVALKVRSVKVFEVSP